MNSRKQKAVPKRIQRLREELSSTGTEFCFARAHSVTRTYKQTEREPSVLRRAKSLKAIFEEMPLFIRPGELLVGQRAEVLAGRSVYPEYNLNGLTQETTPAEIWDYWHGSNVTAETHARYSDALNNAEKEWGAGWVTGSGSGYGHVIVDYEKVLSVGFDGVKEQASGLLDTADAEDGEGRDFLEAVIIACDAMVTWANRYADLAEEQAGKQSEPARAAELSEIARICRKVPAGPAETFHEALQSFWFTHLAMHMEQYGWSISAGRFDRYMIPFYRADLESGRMTREQGWELLLNLWIKFMENVCGGVRHTIFQNLTLGGQDLSGADESNELSFLCCDATVALNFNQPALSVRWHPGINPAFWEHVNATIAAGLGMPAIFNDEEIIPGLEKRGVSHEDAVGYGIVGCVEASVPGKEQGVTAGGHINLAKALELALNDGCSMVTGARLGPPTGPTEDFTTFDQLWDAYASQVEHLADLDIEATRISGEVQKQRGHCSLMSSLLDDCLERRRDLVMGATRYNLPGICIFGNTNTCDSFAAIKELVFDAKEISLSDLRDALRTDFEGREELRLALANRARRFGNDVTEVDELANRVNAVHAEYCARKKDARDGAYTCGVWPVEGHLHTGEWTAATPDGRRKGTPLADGVGACQGADRSGPTALLSSVARLNTQDHWTAGSTCNIKFSRSGIAGPDGVSRLAAMLSSFMQLGGQQLQVNVVDTATLRDAQCNPEQHSDLVVRVAGFSAYFTTLGRKTQDEIISRTEQAVGS